MVYLYKLSRQEKSLKSLTIKVIRRVQHLNFALHVSSSNATWSYKLLFQDGPRRNLKSSWKLPGATRQQKNWHGQTLIIYDLNGLPTRRRRYDCRRTHGCCFFLNIFGIRDLLSNIKRVVQSESPWPNLFCWFLVFNMPNLGKHGKSSLCYSLSIGLQYIITH